jgi:hypothetical protein
VPPAKASNSNTPTGPFQTMVPAFAQLRGQDGGGLGADVEDQVVVGHVARVLDGGGRIGREGLGRDHVHRNRHVGAARLHGFDHRLGLVSRSGSASDLPIFRPAASMKVLAMPPPTISWSTLADRTSGW